MRKTLPYAVILPLILTLACKETPVSSGKSRLEHFKYGGYGDTIFATLYGHVLLDTMGIIPAKNATIHILNNGRQFHTDNLGKFELYSDADTFEIEISLPGYQSLLLKNYISHPDQISTAQIKLSKGKGVEQVVIPSPTP
jgi:hypothetical protein